MIERIQILRGLESLMRPETMLQGELYYSTDTKRIWVGNGDGTASYLANIDDLSNTVHKTGDETKTGIFTLTSSPIFPTPIESDDSNKGATTSFIKRAITTLLSGLLSAGTFTPTIQFGGASVGVTYGLQQGNYIKIGNVVFCDFNITLSNKGTSVGSAIITGLPFNVPTASSVGIGEMYYITMPTLGVSYFGVLTGTTLVLRANRSADAQVDLSNTHFANNSRIRLSFCYRTS